MTKRCRVITSESEHFPSWDVFCAILNRADSSSGAPLVSDQNWLEARQGRRETAAIIDDASDQCAGFVISSETEFDLVVDPPFRGKGIGSCALQQTLAVSTGARTTWVHGENQVADSLLTHAGCTVVRELLKMTLDSTALEATTRNAVTLDSLSLHTFTPADESDWVGLNARVFESHPEQGSLTLDDLRAREREPWFRAENFLLLRDHDEQLIGYCWLKVVTDGSRSAGEIYAIGIAPERAGAGLGGALLDRGLGRLAAIHRDEHPLDEVTLYVEAENAAAIELYRKRGFRESMRSRQWMFIPS